MSKPLKNLNREITVAAPTFSNLDVGRIREDFNFPSDHNLMDYDAAKEMLVFQRRIDALAKNLEEHKAYLEGLKIWIATASTSELAEFVVSGCKDKNRLKSSLKNKVQKSTNEQYREILERALVSPLQRRIDLVKKEVVTAQVGRNIKPILQTLLNEQLLFISTMVKSNSSTIALQPPPKIPRRIVNKGIDTDRRKRLIGIIKCSWSMAEALAKLPQHEHRIYNTHVSNPAVESTLDLCLKLYEGAQKECFANEIQPFPPFNHAKIDTARITSQSHTPTSYTPSELRNLLEGIRRCGLKLSSTLDNNHYIQEKLLVLFTDIGERLSQLDANGPTPSGTQSIGIINRAIAFQLVAFQFVHTGTLEKPTHIANSVYSKDVHIVFIQTMMSKYHGFKVNDSTFEAHIREAVGHIFEVRDIATKIECNDHQRLLSFYASPPDYAGQSRCEYYRSLGFDIRRHLLISC